MRRPTINMQVRMTRRGLVLMGAQLAVVAGLGARMRQLQVQEADRYRMLAEENRMNIRLLAPARGLILDRNGIALAENRQNYRVVIIREQAGDVAAVLDKLARLIPLSDDRREKVLKEVARRAAFVPVTVTERLSWEEIARVAGNAPALPGVLPEVGLTRHYPQQDVGAHVVGYVGPVSERDLEHAEDRDPLLQIPDFQIGKTGIEVREEQALRGSAGASRIEVNALGRVMRELDRREGTPGRDLHLTLDSELQAYALERMAGESAATVVMDVRTGGILASASAPGFDPNAFVFGINYDNWNTLLNDPFRPLSNKAVSGAYPPGSTYKMAVALAALEAGVLDSKRTVWCPGYYQLGNRRFHCWKRGGHGHVNLQVGLEQSCDVYYYDTAREVGVERISAMANRLGVGIPHELPLPAITAGLTPTGAWKQAKYGDAWRIGDTLNAGIGQGYVLASPLQLAVMTARIATGRAVVPTLIRAVDGRPVDPGEAPDLGLGSTALSFVRDGMYQVVNNRRGTAYKARIADPENEMAGKTGTSQVRNITVEERARGVVRNEDLPWNRRDHGLFVCYAPYNNPRYAVATVVEHGGGGSSAAAPVARDIMMRALYGPVPPLAAYPPGERDEIERRRAEEPQPQGPERPEGGSDRA
ncbi:penicillin-binding protein 2 [Rhodobacteraceae bacterium 2CG4]|uniref:Penicillin-binding protein 2 n=1 Tax=Halovulum marinum TaxID=2662447 RepID=A0A6L5YUJ0_9RHOB|nr:penicillin-binding protein 2 [Halovulum marinum]MSU88096.1 penicillin-binding protein 2 [Halovulum marinum]